MALFPIASPPFRLLDNGLVRVLLPVLLIAVGLMLGGEATSRLLRYQRDAVLAGQWWRVVSGNLVHLGWTHLVLNAAGLALAAILFGRLRRSWEWSLILLACAVGVGLGLLVASPRVNWYVGLSGVAHGIVVAGCISLVRQHRGAGLTALLLVALKLLWEHWMGAAPGSELAIGGHTVTDAHAYGAAAGLIASLLLGAVGTLRSRSDRRKDGPRTDTSRTPK